MEQPIKPRISRRDAIRWMVTASASVAVLGQKSFGADTPPVNGQPAALTHSEQATPPAPVAAVGYGTDPDLMKMYKPGDVWPLTLTDAQRKTTAALCDVIIPADDQSPSASHLNVQDFIDEWISAPYPGHDKDRQVILTGLAWLDTESSRRFSKNFVELSESQKTDICDDIAYAAKAKKEFQEPAHFFNQFRNLASGGFYTTPEGMKDLKYIGNVALPAFDGPPPEALRKAGLL